jgi:hypothetical protein
MAILSYKRVSGRRVCRICGKRDWCSYTPDEKISFCARIIENATRISRTGWGIFHHEKIDFVRRRLPCPAEEPPPKAELAPLEIRHFAYQKLIELAPASRTAEILNGPKGLRARKILDFENYGSMPPNRTERNALAKNLRNQINREFPDFGRENNSSIKGVPGFWLDKGGRARLWQDKDYNFPLLVIPYRNQDGLIQACQLRFMTESALTLRYAWLSMPAKSGGLSSGSPLHFAGRGQWFSEKSVFITEGALKAETVKVFKPDLSVVASGGATCSHEQVISVSRFRPVILGFDKDYAENKHVARAVAKLVVSRFEDSRDFNYEFNLSLLTWDGTSRGIDDALLQKSAIRKISALEWFESLCGKVKTEAHGVLKEILQPSFRPKFSISA